MGAGEVGVGVDHLRLDPQPELHAEPADGVDQRVQAVRPDVLVDVPVAEPGGVVATVAEPAVVEDEPLDADLRGHVGELGEPAEVVVEVDGLPGVEHDRPRAAWVVRTGAQMSVEACGQAVEPDAVRGVHPRAGVALPRRERDLARQQQLAAPEHGEPGRQPLGVLTWLPLHATCTAHTSPRRVSKPAVPAARISGASGPVRPRRFSRECTPTTNGSRCGDRSRPHRPARSNSSVATGGTGRVSTQAVDLRRRHPRMRGDRRPLAHEARRQQLHLDRHGEPGHLVGTGGDDPPATRRVGGGLEPGQGEPR